MLRVHADEFRTRTCVTHRASAALLVLVNLSLLPQPGSAGEPWAESAFQARDAPRESGQLKPPLPVLPWTSPEAGIPLRYRVPPLTNLGDCCGRGTGEARGVAASTGERLRLPAHSTLAEYLRGFRTTDRLRLWNVWQGHSSSVSLQAGKGGEARLQWSSPTRTDGQSEHGIFDQLFGGSMSELR